MVRPWFESVISIQNIYWRAQIFTWLVGAHPILTNQINQPSQFPEDLHLSVRWDWSHTLDGDYSGNPEPSVYVAPFMPAESRQSVLEVAGSISMKKLLEVLSHPRLKSVAAETSGLSKRFLELYGTDS